MPFKMHTINVPIINLRKEFFQHHDLIHSEEFMCAAFNSTVPVQLPSMLWSGLPNDLFTLMTQRAISGLEASIVAAAEYELLKAGRLTPDIQDSLDDPFSLRGSAVKVLYDKVPELVSKDVMLSNINPELYEKTRSFYKEIRNPIFHGNQLVCTYESYPVLTNVYEHMRLLHSWIDEWCSVFRAA
jgi:hypothetical protein